MINQADLTKYNIEIARSPNRGRIFRLIGFRHLPGAENGNNHHVFIWIQGADGQRLRRPDLRIRSAIPGHGMAFYPLDKPDNAPGSSIERGHGNVPMSCNAVYSISITDTAGTPSDAVRGLSPNHPDEGPFSTRCHHSFELTFRETIAGDAGDNGDPGPGEKSEIAAWLAAGDAIAANLSEWIATGRRLLRQ